MKEKLTIFIGASILVMSLLAACTGTGGTAVVGEQGPAGPQGPSGPEGPAGPTGPSAAEYVGSTECQECHQEIYSVFMDSGHPYKLNKVVEGQPPDYPFSSVPNPPEGYTWDDIAYVIGGYGWKARFIDLDGFIITGDENATTQYNLYNAQLEMGDNWVGYHAGEENKPYDCGTCHTTGYSAWPADAHQDDLPGLIGTWTEDGVFCEECHGPASLHIESPRGISMEVDRSSEQCGECHSRGSVEEVNASGGFIKHHEQYEELYQSKHLVLDCVDCHDPHAGVIQLRKTDQPPTRTTCESCHFMEEKFQAVEDHLKPATDVDCIDCHMPRVSKSALGNAAVFSGDLRTHVMAIDPYQVGQFSEDGSVAYSQISLDFACKSCHIPDTEGELTDAVLENAAIGYHDRP
jgi:hypothetical protein